MLRWLVLAVVAVVEAILLYVAWMFIANWIGELQVPSWRVVGEGIRDLPRDGALAALIVGMPIGVALATVAFIAPLAPPMRLRSSPQSMYMSVIAAAFIGGGLAFGAIVAIVETALLLAGHAPIAERFDGSGMFLVAVAMIVVLGWLVWTTILWRWGDRADHSRAARLLRVILGGSAIEFAIVIPAYAYARSKESCFCGLASFWALACGLGGLFFVAGPGALLIWYRQTGRWVDHRATNCPRCRYPRSDGSGSRCPECGAAWLPLHESPAETKGRATDGI